MNFDKLLGNLELNSPYCNPSQSFPSLSNFLPFVFTMLF